MSNSFYGLLAAIINVSTVVPYCYAVIRGEAKPSKVTWGIWTFLSLVIFIASAACGAKSTLFYLGAATFNSILIFSLSLRFGVWEKSPLEFACLLLGVSGIVVWYLTREASYSVFISLFVDLLAILPTIKKVWRGPLSEPKIAWSMGFVATTVNMWSIDSMRLVILLPPLCAFLWHIPVLIPMYLLRNKQG